MANKKIEKFEELKKGYVRAALETNNITTTAKGAGVAVNTLRKWMKEYKDEVSEEMEREGFALANGFPTENDYKRKYEQAMKLLGEKELEVTVLRDALKKKDI